jgi:hypothetical protein
LAKLHSFSKLFSFPNERNLQEEAYLVGKDPTGEGQKLEDLKNLKNHNIILSNYAELKRRMAANFVASHLGLDNEIMLATMDTLDIDEEAFLRKTKESF